MPWAIRSKLLRKLRTSEFRVQVSDADADGSVLVVGEPFTDDPAYPPLPGARAEANAVAARLTDGRGGLDATRVRALTSGADDARTIINALFERPYRIVHVAGHGDAVPESLDSAARERPDFWAVVGQIELRVLAAVAGRRLSGEVAPLIDEFESLKARVPSPSDWDNVYDAARFILEPYARRSGAAERRAASALLDALGAMASTN